MTDPEVRELLDQALGLIWRLVEEFTSLEEVAIPPAIEARVRDYHAFCTTFDAIADPERTRLREVFAKARGVVDLGPRDLLVKHDLGPSEEILAAVDDLGERSRRLNLLLTPCADGS